MVLDEPTNDLDIETLELLEEVLLEYTGTVLLVSHDRDFMDKVVTSLLVINDNGVVDEQAGGFSDWEARGVASNAFLLRIVSRRRRHQRPIKNQQSKASSAPLAS